MFPTESPPTTDKLLPTLEYCRKEIADPMCKKFKTDAADANLPKLRNEIELPRWNKSMTEVCAPIRKLPGAIDREDDNRLKFLRLQLDPTCMKFRIDTALPNLAKLLTEMFDPRWKKSRTLVLASSLALQPTPVPHEKADPSRVMALMERVDPNQKQSRTLIVDPNRAKDLKDILDPICRKLKTLMQPPTSIVLSVGPAEIDKPEDNLVKLLRDSADPQVTKSNIDIELPHLP